MWMRSPFYIFHFAFFNLHWLTVHMPTDIQLVVFDMEGTLTDDPTVWELMHLKLGTWESHGKSYWEQYKQGRFDYDEFARRDVATWRDAPVALLEEAVHEVPLMRGCAELLEFLDGRGIRTAIVSNGLERLALRLARQFPISHVRANREVVRNDRLTGEVSILVPFHDKGKAMLQVAAELRVAPESVMAVGDGAADIGMFRSAGESVAFRPAEKRVADAATHIVNKPDLKLLMPLFG